MSEISTAVDPNELPLAERPRLAGWTENYCNQAYCPEAQVGFWTHLSRLAGGDEIWRDLFIAYLPGDRFLVAKGYGRNGQTAGPASGMLSLACDESWRRWTMRFHGAVRDVAADELATGALRDRFHKLATLELSWEATAPVWNLGQRMEGQTWAQAHYEQACDVTGELVLDGERWELSGTGIRDHSRGARYFGTVREHWWLSGQFPSGRSFAVLQVINHGDTVQPLSHAYVSDGEEVVDAEVSSIEILESTDHGSPLRTRITLQTPEGQQVIEGRILQTMPFAMGDPNELILGKSDDPVRAPLALSECQTEYAWAGETGYGLTERSRTPRDA
ncbi:MAG: DUF7065 domain-containing protein [Solirubrobacteraceae bacterium]